MKRENFNQNWQFRKDSGGTFSIPAPPVTVHLPHDAMILEPRDKDNPTGNGGGFFPGENYSYTKSFSVPAEWRERYVLLEFEGVYNRCRVYLNGNYICENKNGYTRFHADLTPHLRYGAENTVEVKVINGDEPNSRWYTGSGIYRPVYLLTGGKLRIAENGVKVSTPEAAEDISVVDTAIQIRYAGSVTRSIMVETVLRDGDGKKVAQEKTKVTVFGKDDPLIRQRIYVCGAKLWEPDDPALYTCEVRLVESGDVIDQDQTTFGIRHIQADPVHGFRLNGKKILLRGACIHHDNGILGAAAFACAEERKVRQLKEAGFNALRIAHNPASTALLDACDRMGMLVMEESFDMWNHEKNTYDYARDFSQNWEKDVESVVAKDYNHPCVVMYCIGNEIREIGTDEGARWNRRIAEKFRSLDGTRFVTNALNGLLPVMDQVGQIMFELGIFPTDKSGTPTNDINEIMTATMKYNDRIMAHRLVGEKLEESCGALDLCGYNYMTGRYAKDQEMFPNRLIYGSETYPPQIAENWDYVKKNPSILGDFTWTGYDYLGEAGAGVNSYNAPGGFFTPYPCYLANVGDIDITGVRRPMSYYREIVWGLRKAPYIAVQLPEHYSDMEVMTPWTAADSVSSWSWTGYEGKPCKVEVYSADEEVELLINGTSVGRKAVGEERRFAAVFDTVYEPGTVEAVSYTEGMETGRTKIKTAGNETRLNIETDRKLLHADGEDLAYLMISLTDEKGILKPSESAKVSITVEGAGKLQGFGNADPFSLENFYDTERTTYRGRVAAAVRSGEEPGEIRVRVRAEGFADEVITLEVK